MRSFGVFLVCMASATIGCRSRTDQPAPEVQPATPSRPAEPPADKAATAVTAPVKKATLGQPAPDFTLTDVDGQSVSLSSFKGKTVVLEWFNPECPFVRNSYTKGSLVGTAEKHRAAGVVWLSINSGAAGKQGSGKEKNAEARSKFSIKHPVLLDETGAVGQAYGAKTTPHLFVIAPDGTLVYRGGIDNSPDGEKESPKGGQLVNYVDEALGALAANKPVPNPDTEPYGCSVKYAN